MGNVAPRGRARGQPTHNGGDSSANLPAARESSARQGICSRILTAAVARLGDRLSADEEPEERVYRVANVERAIVVRVQRLEAGGLAPVQEEERQSGDRVRQVEHAAA